MEEKIKMENTREKIADLEHQQWESWSRYVSENNVLPTELIKKWAKNWKPYSNLDEKTKDSDRIWADKVIEVFVELIEERIKYCKSQLKEDFEKDKIWNWRIDGFEELIKTLKD
ncbi:hypothetical protein LCGC14_1954850 [marine sediment metagenome]|uniref:Uncharacterized protein n=1 Tax=marine sediment metagenome TaxID=412755 RepID=A0A0F9IDH9_9ZZZZ